MKNQFKKTSEMKDLERKLYYNQMFDEAKSTEIAAMLSMTSVGTSMLAKSAGFEFMSDLMYSMGIATYLLDVSVFLYGLKTKKYDD